MNRSRLIRKALWKASLRHRPVWMRALRISVWVGAVQIAVNQGDHWLMRQITPGVILKTILTPMITFAVSFYAAAATYVEQQLKHESSS